MRRHAALLLVAVICWGTSVSISDLALTQLRPIDLFVLEIGFGTAVVAGIASYSRRRTGAPRPRGGWATIAVLGTLEPAGAYMFANVGLARTSASVASILLALESVFAVLASAWFLGERFRRTDLVGVGLGLAGAIVVATSSDGGTSSLTGNAFVVLSALAAAGFFVVSRRAGAAMPVADLVARQGLVGLLVVLPYAAWVWFHQGSSLLTSGAGPIALGLLAGLIGYVVPMTLWMQVAHRLPAGFAAVALYVVPVAGVGSSALLGRGGLDLASATGGILVLVALAVLGLHGRAPEVTVADGDGGADRQAWSNERTADSMPPDEGSMVSAAR